MAGNTIDLDDILTKDDLACRISDYWRVWNNMRREWLEEKDELKKYLYATSTKHTTQKSSEWKNTTTIPKMTQIRDNLLANYMASIFPKRKWIRWEGLTPADETKETTKVVKDFMTWAVNQAHFKEEIRKLIMDYLDYGNCFASVEWVDRTTVLEDGTVKPGFVGPKPIRYSPLDLVMNPIAKDFASSPKIIRVLTSIGEAKEILERFSSTREDEEVAQKVFDYCLGLRQSMKSYGSSELSEKDELLHIDGFDSFRQYLQSDYVELLFFYGDIYDSTSNEFKKNRQIVVIDKHKVVYDKPVDFPMAEVPIYHAGWRMKQDNLWAMGPFDNLVGLQYRLDQTENQKADMVDLTTAPPIVIKGMVNDFTWGPLEKIYVDNDGDVKLMSPRPEVLQQNIELAAIESRMEEMSGSPKEAMGFRTPGEKTAYEVQRLENAASRIFQNKIAQFEEQIIEPLLNAMLILAQSNMSDTTIRVIEDEFKSAQFATIRRQDLSANGKLRAVAARHFAEKAERIQNLNNFYQSALGQDPEVRMHLSSVKLAEMVEDLIDLTDYEIVTPNIRLSEQAEAQQFANTLQENVVTTAESPAGLTPEDFSGSLVS